MKSKRFSLVFLALSAAFLLVGSLSAQKKPAAPDKLLGSWALEVNAGDALYYLSLDLKLTEGKLGGVLSEQNGIFTNVPLTEIEWDGTTLKFMANTPTPPDGAVLPIKTELKLVDGKLAGTITIVEMGMTAPVAGTKK